eukprot:PITA_32115
MTKLIDEEPSIYEEAINQHVWKEAMNEECQSILKIDVWDIVPRLEWKSVVTFNWIYKIKHIADGSIDKYKAQFVARVFSQEKGEDYDETFASVSRYTSIRSIISFAASMGWELRQMDVKTTFLNGVTGEEVYIEQPQGFEVYGKESNVCRLKKALYGLKQASRAWCQASYHSVQEAVGFRVRYEGSWVDALLLGIKRLFNQQLEPTVMHCGNQSCVKLSENPVFHDRSKHIEIKYHYIRDMVLTRAIRLEYISTDEQTTNVLMKPLLKDKFVYFINKLGLMEITPLVEREC